MSRVSVLRFKCCWFVDAKYAGLQLVKCLKIRMPGSDRAVCLAVVEFVTICKVTRGVDVDSEQRRFIEYIRVVLHRLASTA